jgi:short-subunit dehydrogenase involved in D-alanine esterification of teichoic acids
MLVRFDPAVIHNAREIFETNFTGSFGASQAFAPVLRQMAEGRSSTVLSDVTWFAQPILTACAATAWSFANALRIDVRATRVFSAHPARRFRGYRTDPGLR